MKSFILFLSATVILVACNNSSDQPSVADDTVDISPSVTSWQATLNDSSGRLEMVRTDTTGPDTLSPAAVVAFLNNANANVKLEFVRTSNDTIYIKIPEAMYLTQQMGSTGPTLFFAKVVYNLTEIAGIKYASFDFEEGDHASPGTYNRDSFRDE
jgi:hypothetical protein